MIFAFADLELDVERHELRRAGKLVKADATAVRLLAALVTKAPKLVTKDELVEEVWEGRSVADNVVTVAMARLRKMLSHRRGEREFIATSYGRGYRFVYPLERRRAVERTTLKFADTNDVPSALVGRQRQLTALRRALQRASAGRGRLCTLMGEPGIGKTYLAEALERELSCGQVRVAWGFCREAGDTPPLGPWLRLIREVMTTTQRLDWDLQGDTVSELESMLRALDMRDMEDAQLSDFIERVCARGPKRHHLFDTITRFLAQASEHVPWLLVLEDLHRVDDASLAMLQHLLDEISHMRVVVLATLRPGEMRGEARLQTRLPLVLGHRNCERVALERLTEQEVMGYVASVLDDPDGRLGRAVYEKSEGNAFFMAELTRQLFASGHSDPDAVTLPRVSLDLVRQHLSRLEPATREVLSVAAVIGRSFELSLLRAIVALSPSALMARVDEAIAAEVVIAAPDSKTGFAFGHELFRTVLYDALSPADRRRMHLQVATALEARLDSGDPAEPSELAHHFHAALPETDLRKTVDFCRRAAASAAIAGANAEVVRYMRHALEALQLLERPSVRLRMHLLYVTSMFSRGTSSAEFTSATRELLTLAREQRNPLILVCGAFMLNLHPTLKPLPGVASALELALEVLPPEKRGLRAAARAGLATSTPACFTERGPALSDEAVAIARASGARMPRYVSLLSQLHLYGGPAHAERIVPVVDELELLSQQNRGLMPTLAVDLSFHRALSSLQRGDLAGMSTALDRATARCRETQQGELLWHCMRLRALSKVNLGDLAAGVAELAALHRQAEQRAFLGTSVFCAFDRAVVFSAVSGTTDFDDAFRGELSYDASEPPNIWAFKVRALAALGLDSEARAMLRAGATPEALRRLPCDTHYLGTLGHLAQAVVRLRDLDYAEVLYELLAPYAAYFAVQISFFCEGSVPQLLGILAHALGRYDPAVEHLHEGIALSDRAGFVLSAAEGRVALARCLLERGSREDRDEVNSLRRQVAASAGRFGMRQLASDAWSLGPAADVAAP